MNDDLYLETIIEQAKQVGKLEELVHIQGKLILKQSDKIEILEPQNKRYREALEWYSENSPKGIVADEVLEDKNEV